MEYHIDPSLGERVNKFILCSSLGPVAQSVERAHGMREARGSKPLGSTKIPKCPPCMDFLDSALLQKPTDTPAVHRVVREAVYLPTDNTLRFAALNTPHHVLKNETARHLRAPLLHKLLHNL